MSRKPQARPAMTEALRTTASKALRYEYRMLEYTAALLDGARNDARKHVERNAYLESFLVHARALTDALYEERAFPDDVLAEDLFDDPAEWHGRRGAKPASLRDPQMLRIHGEIAHITYRRTWEHPSDKDWHVSAMLRDLRAAVGRLLSPPPKGWRGELPFPEPPSWERPTAIFNSTSIRQEALLEATVDVLPHGPVYRLPPGDDRSPS